MAATTALDFKVNQTSATHASKGARMTATRPTTFVPPKAPVTSYLNHVGRPCNYHAKASSADCQSSSRMVRVMHLKRSKVLVLFAIVWMFLLACTGTAATLSGWQRMGSDEYRHVSAPPVIFVRGKVGRGPGKGVTEPSLKGFIRKGAQTLWKGSAAAAKSFGRSLRQLAGPTRRQVGSLLRRQPATVSPAAPKSVVENVVIQSGGRSVQTSVDLRGTIKRIQDGKQFPHRNDGSIFVNREGRLPMKEQGYYREYVHPTTGESGPGPQRIIRGKGGEWYYSPDHYKTFIPLN